MEKIATEAIRTGILPILSERAPMKMPVRAIASAGSVIIKEMVDSDASGNAWLINGRAGATAAPPMRIIMADSKRKSNVHFVGLNGVITMPYMIANVKIYGTCS